MAAFDLALNLLRNGMDDLLSPDHVNQLAAAQNHLFRNTFLTPGNTLRLFVQQVAGGNVACSAMRHLAGADFSDSAWCQARSRLPLELIDQVQRQVVERGQHQLNSVQTIGDPSYRWRGHRTYVIDGASDSMPDTPELRSHYGVPAASSPGLGFPASHLLLLMDHRSGLFVDCQDAPGNTHDASVASSMHRHLQPGDILLGDDAFGTYAHIALLLQAHLHAVMPVHHKRIVDFTPDRAYAHPRQGKSQKRLGKPRSRLLKTLGREDQLVEYFRPPNKPQWMSPEQWDQMPESIIVREIRRVVSRHGFRTITVTLLTTLLDPQQYPADELIELRLSRWMIETNLRHLKVTLGMSVLKCKTLDGVRKERMIFLLVYNLIRLIMLQAAWRQGIHANRLSFADTLAWLRHGNLRQPVDLKINPLRPCRLEPRAIKRNDRRFPFMTKPRAVLKSQLREKYCVAT